ncbi:TetR/AcrR family transcriptional regulator [Halobacillus locisalis]|uniref:TetR/AcrR family transcriptional regulator n=1 Tax=Halobacillus locisalis TaxID=220753 RepID=A0A838CTI7_9BACI|nr:TetR/AcrR family transcriptional regulator [Halobacillus locisalis]MBA2175129.1 TetR/AcrR family transcriptional regulator [Halobacillus locisalis]
MDEKSIHIIEESIKLFAKKGFSSTSVQEIANECGISKGAFYLHFKSKDALLLELFNHFYHQIQRKIDDVQSEDLDPRTKFKEQLRITFEEIADHREFIIMQIREQAIPFNDHIDDFLTKMRFNTYLFYKRQLLSMYGKEIDAAVWEVSLIIHGIFKGFIDLIIIEGAKLDYDEISQAILRRTDYIVAGFKQSGDQPVITEEFMNKVIPEDFYKQELDEMIQTIVAFKEKSTGDLQVTLTVLLDEIQKREPRAAIIKGMLSNLEEDAAYQGIAGQIRTYYQL